MMRLGAGSLLIVAVMGLQMGVMVGMVATGPADATVEFDSEEFVVSAGGETIDLCESDSTERNEAAVIEREVTAGTVELDSLPVEEPTTAKDEQPAYCDEDPNYTDGTVESHPINVIDWSPDYAMKNMLAKSFGLFAAVGTPVAQVVYHSPLPDLVWVVGTPLVSLLVPIGYVGLRLRAVRRHD